MVCVLSSLTAAKSQIITWLRKLAACLPTTAKRVDEAAEGVAEIAVEIAKGAETMADDLDKKNNSV